VFLTILIPCLNEAETIGKVIQKAQIAIQSSGLVGEVLIVDNGSTDSSIAISLSLGARVIEVSEIGYGSALKAGIASSQGDVTIMCDADDSYDIENISSFIQQVADGSDLVIGNRFKGGIGRGAMPWLHKYVGNPILSWLGRLFFKVQIGDFHCGIRAFKTESIRSLNLKSSGMEFASEMVVKASLHGLKIAEVPTVLNVDGRSRAPHLKTWRDGWRHLVFLLAASPRWLFLYPGLLLTFIGSFGFALTSVGPLTISRYQFDLNSFIIFIGLILIGVQVIFFGVLARIFSTNFGILPETSSVTGFSKMFSLERGVALGGILLLTSIAAAVGLLLRWDGNTMIGLDRDSALRISGIIVLTSGVGIQTLFASFFASMLQAK
jgi:glycosyltransferase involved in cell wall biosynthesis